MAAPNQGHHGRTLGLLTLLVLVLTVWTFWPGQPHTPKLGLDLRGGTQVILTPQVTEGEADSITQEQLDQTVNIIRQRIDGFGVAEAEVTTQGSGANSAVVVSVPGELSQEQQDAIASTAKLDFRPVLAAAGGIPTTAPSASPTPEPTATGSASPKPKKSAKASPKASGNGAAVTGGLLPAADPTASPGATTPPASPTGSASPSAGPTDNALLPPIQSKTNDAALQAKYDALDCTAKDALTGGKPVDPTQYMATCQTDGTAKYLLAPATVLGTQLTSAQASPPQQGIGGWTVNLSLQQRGRDAFLKTTTDLSQQQPPMNQFAHRARRSRRVGAEREQPDPRRAGGDLRQLHPGRGHRARQRAQVRRAAADLQVGSVEQVSPTLGQDQLIAGLIAGGLGLLLVVMYLLLYYRALGTVAVASLFVAGWITYCMFVILGRQLGLSLSLAGVAGAIVAIGITADSFIVYFERIRDEVRDGRTLRAACRDRLAARSAHAAGRGLRVVPRGRGPVLRLGGQRPRLRVRPGTDHPVDVGVSFWFTRPMVAVMARSKWFASGSRMTGISADRIGHAAEHAEDVVRRAPRPSRRRPEPEGVLMSRLGSIGHSLYSGEVSYDFVGQAPLVLHGVRGVPDPRRRRPAGPRAQPRHRVQGRRPSSACRTRPRRWRRPAPPPRPPASRTPWCSRSAPTRSGSRRWRCRSTSPATSSPSSPRTSGFRRTRSACRWSVRAGARRSPRKHCKGW